MARERKSGWFEEYRCGCVSEIVKTTKDLLGYCGKHGDDRRRIYPVFKKVTSPKQPTEPKKEE